MAEKENNKKTSLFGSDDVIEPEEVIASDKNQERQNAFKEAYKRVMQIVPKYFMTQRKRKNGTGSGGFSQSIVVTPENVKIETKETKAQENVKEMEEDRERAD